MRPALRQPRAIAAALLGVAMLVGCATDKDGRPPQKPATMTGEITVDGGSEGQPALKRVRVSTKSGEILILEEDGSVSSMDLDSSAGQDAFALTEADLAALEVNLDLNLGPTSGVAVQQGPTAQEKALEEFAKRTQPALPNWTPGTEVVPEDFIGARVVSLNPDGQADLVEVTANLRQGVDADIAFSYATCALAGWAKQNGSNYGRHIRTLQQKRDGKLLIGAAFTISDSKPMGLRVMETNETLRECKARGIPAA
jgi:hypothetical protein